MEKAPENCVMAMGKWLKSWCSNVCDWLIESIYRDYFRALLKRQFATEQVDWFDFSGDTVLWPFCKDALIVWQTLIKQLSPQKKRFPYLASIWSGPVFSVVNRPIRNYYMTEKKKLQNWKLWQIFVDEKKKKKKQTCSLFKNCRHFFYFQIESWRYFFLLNIHPCKTQELLKVERSEWGLFFMNISLGDKKFRIMRIYR